jgi:hypothetical protein
MLYLAIELGVWLAGAAALGFLTGFIAQKVRR